MREQGQYLYAIVAINEEKSFGPIGIGDQNSEVYTICYRDIGAVISDSTIFQYPITRANTIAHQKVMEEVMKQHSMLPVRFGTIGEGIPLIMEKVLTTRYEELRDSLNYMRDKVELGVKAIWPDIKPIFQEIAEKNKDIVRLKQSLMQRKGGTQREQVRLGEMVKDALNAKKVHEEQSILSSFQGLWVEQKIGTPFGDQIVTNTAFLVEKDKEETFDRAVEDVVAMYDDKMKFKYVGPVPPCNFVEIVVKW
jgi:hypothetical protein